MKTQEIILPSIARWIGFFVIWFLCSFLVIILSQNYFGWLLPLSSLKDWIIFLLLTPLSIFMLLGQYVAILAGSAIVKEEQRNLCYIIAFLLMLLSIVYSIFFTETSWGFQAKLNAFQIAIATILCLIYFISSKE